MRAVILAAVTTLGLSVNVAGSHAAAYQPPAHNFYQNNWMSRD
ncbi:MAG TPA: hypothetical protein VGC09_18700 [Rhodopila sp.]